MVAEVTPSEITAFLDALVTEGHIIYRRSVIQRGAWVTWPVTSPEIFETDPYSEETYNRLLRNGDFSAVISDGSLLQISVRNSRRQVAESRLAYYPCPFHIELSSEDEAMYLLHSHAEEYYADANNHTRKLRSHLRFDFSPAAGNESHPTAHLTWNSTTCRLPVQRYMSPQRFITFILQIFYEFDCSRFIQGKILESETFDLLSEGTHSTPHLTWTFPIPSGN